MFSNNNQISNRQIKRTLVFDAFSISTLIVPYIAVNGAGQNGLAAVVAAALMAAVYGVLMYQMGKMIVTTEDDHGTLNYMRKIKKLTGSVPAAVFCLFYLFKFTITLIFLLHLFSNVIGETLLTETNRKVIMVSLILVAAYGGSKGVEKRARLTELLYFFVLIPFGIFLVMGLNEIDIMDVIPVFTGSGGEISSILKTGYMVFLTFTSLEMILFLMPYMKKNKQGYVSGLYHSILQGIAVIAVLQFLIYTVTAGILGKGETGDKLWSAVTTMQIVELPGGFMRRPDGIMLAIWILSIFTVLSTCFFQLIQITHTLIYSCLFDFMKNGEKRAKKIYFILFYVIAVYWMANIDIHLEKEAEYFGKFIAYIGIPGSIIIPLSVLLIHRIRTVQLQSSKEE